MTNDRFRDAIDINFGDLDVTSKKHLEILMRRRRFLTGKTVEGRQNQLDSAWGYLKTIQGGMPVTSTKYVSSNRFVYSSKLKKNVYVRKDYRVISPKGFKRSQIRDSKGRIVKWI